MHGDHGPTLADHLSRSDASARAFSPRAHAWELEPLLEQAVEAAADAVAQVEALVVELAALDAALDASQRALVARMHRWLAERQHLRAPDERCAAHGA